MPVDNNIPHVQAQFFHRQDSSRPDDCESKVTTHIFPAMLHTVLVDYTCSPPHLNINKHCVIPLPILNCCTAMGSPVTPVARASCRCPGSVDEFTHSCQQSWVAWLVGPGWLSWHFGALCSHTKEHARAPALLIVPMPVTTPLSPCMSTLCILTTCTSVYFFLSFLVIAQSVVSVTCTMSQERPIGP
jgi:hypothetical protein